MSSSLNTRYRQTGPESLVTCVFILSWFLNGVAWEAEFWETQLWPYDSGLKDAYYLYLHPSPGVWIVLLPAVYLLTTRPSGSLWLCRLTQSEHPDVYCAPVFRSFN